MHLSNLKGHVEVMSQVTDWPLCVRYREGTNTLGIIFFCLVFGTVLGTLGRRARVVIEFFSAIDEVIMKMVTGVMWYVYTTNYLLYCQHILYWNNKQPWEY